MSSKRRKSRCKRARAETFGQALDSCPSSTTFAAAHTKTNPSTSNHHWGLCEQIRRGSRQQCRRLHRKEEWRFYPQENDWPDPTNLKESITHKLLSRIVHPKIYFLGGRKIASYMWTKHTWWRLSIWLLRNTIFRWQHAIFPFIFCCSLVPDQWSYYSSDSMMTHWCFTLLLYISLRM